MPNPRKKVNLPHVVRIKNTTQQNRYGQPFFSNSQHMLSLRKTIKPGNTSIAPHPIPPRHAARISIMNDPIPSLAEPIIKPNKLRNSPSQSRPGSGSPSKGRPRSPKRLSETNFGSKSNKGRGFPKQNKSKRNLRAAGGLRAVRKDEFESLAEAAKRNLAGKK